MKIKKIEVTNFKAIENKSIDFNGCTAIVTAGNNKGKTSLLRGLIDRIQGYKPDLIVKIGAENGKNIMHLSDGSQIEWFFTQKSDRINYITSDGFVIKSGAIKMLQDKIFGKRFDIDSFLNSPPKKQIKILKTLLNIDTEQLEVEYKVAYDNRTYSNKKVLELKARQIDKPIKPNVNLKELQIELDKAIEHNQKLEAVYEKTNKKHIAEIQKFNTEQSKKKELFDEFQKELNVLETIKILKDAISFKKVNEIMTGIRKPQPIKKITMLPKPDYIDLEPLRNKVENTKLLLHNYNTEYAKYKELKEQLELAEIEAKKADNKVKSIEQKEKELLEKSRMPIEFEIKDGEVYYNGFPLSSEQLSSSSKYIASLKLGFLALGELRTLHFDASFLDNNSLKQVMNWAEENDLQLLIERPDMQGGDINYELIYNF